jgi:transcriptional regulator with XRE-family HTH domain
MTFGEKLRGLRIAKGLSQSDLAKKIGVTQGAVGFWESGERVPAFDAVHALCKALGVRCTIFDECDFAKAEEKRGRGRPKKS